MLISEGSHEVYRTLLADSWESILEVSALILAHLWAAAVEQQLKTDPLTDRQPDGNLFQETLEKVISELKKMGEPPLQEQLLEETVFVLTIVWEYGAQLHEWWRNLPDEKRGELF